MSRATSPFLLYPWIGGVNTSVEESTIPPNELLIADNVEFGIRGSRRQRDGIDHSWDGSAEQSASVIGLFDFWFGDPTRTNLKVSVLSNKAIYSYSSGTRSADIFGDTAWPETPTVATMCAFNNVVIIAVDGAGNVPKKWNGNDAAVSDLGGTPPDASMFREHLGRLWANQKDNPDRIHCSPAGDHETWNGEGDSWAIDIAPGDGDPVGITCFFSFRGALYVGKHSRLYKVIGNTPEEFTIVNISKSLGIAGPKSFAYIDDTDVIFVSNKGVHSIAQLEAQGDEEAAYLSKDIQGTFNDNWVKTRLGRVSCAYLPNLNSFAVAVTDSSLGSVYNNALWMFNIPLKAWYRWTGLTCESLMMAEDADKQRLYLGTNTGRVSKTLNGTNYDISGAGTHTQVVMRLKTGRIYLDGNPLTTKMLKHLFLLYKPGAPHSINVSVRVDNQPYQVVNFTNSGSNALLGTTFTLGSSVLGYNVVMGPYYKDIDGSGRSVQILVETSGVNRFCEIQGLGIEFEPADLQLEMVAE